MSDRCHVKIIIGGNIPLSLLGELASRLKAEGLVDPEVGSPLSSAAAYAGLIVMANQHSGTLEFERNEVNGGRFSELVEFLEANQICYKEFSDALSGCWDAGMTVFRDGKTMVCATDSNESIYVPLGALQKAFKESVATAIDLLADYSKAAEDLPPINIIG